MMTKVISNDGQKYYLINLNVDLGSRFCKHLMSNTFGVLDKILYHSNLQKISSKPISRPFDRHN